MAGSEPMICIESNIELYSVELCTVYGVYVTIYNQKMATAQLETTCRGGSGVLNAPHEF